MAKTKLFKRTLSAILAFALMLSLFGLNVSQNVKAEEQPFTVDGTNTTFNISVPKVKEKEHSSNWYIAKKNYYKDIPDFSLEFFYPEDFSTIPTSGLNNAFKVFNSDRFDNSSIVGELSPSSWSIKQNNRELDISLSADKIRDSGIPFEELKTYYIVIDPFWGSTQYGTSHQIVFEFIYYLPNIQYPDYESTVQIEPGSTDEFTILLGDEDTDLSKLLTDLEYKSLGSTKVAKIWTSEFIVRNNRIDLVCTVKGYTVGGNVFTVWQKSTSRLLATVHIQVQNVNYKTTCINSPIDFTFYTKSSKSSLNVDGYAGSYDIVDSKTEYDEDLELFKQYLAISFDSVASNFAIDVKDEDGEQVVSYYITTENHKFGEWNIELDANCSSPAVYGRYCEKCSYREEKYGDSLGSHVWMNSYTVDKEAGHLEPGKKSIHCSICGAIKENSEETIPAAGHTKEKVKGYAATCTKEGLTDGEKCSVCGEWITKQEVIKAKGHTFEKGVCTVCGEKDPNYKPEPAPTPVSKQNGLADSADSNGDWWFYKDGKIDKTHNGVDQNKYGWWRVENGKVNFNAQGIYQNSMGWWKTTNGKVTFKETGVFQNNLGWWRVKDSKVDFNAQSIYQNQFGWWKTTNGKVTFKENGLFKNQYGTWKVENSKVNFNFNGSYQGKTIKNGKVV